MKIIDTELDGVKIITTPKYGDERGYFTESYNKAQLEELGFNVDFVQDNLSKSKYRTIRGLHYQRNPDQGKLVRCITGTIFDVAVDIRKGSPTYGDYVGVELSEDNNKMLFVPAGFAHGFSVISQEDARVMYKVDGKYNRLGEGGIIYDDTEINIDWKVEYPLLSTKDREMHNFSEYNKNPAFTYSE